MGGGDQEVKETADMVAAQENNVKLFNMYLEKYKPFVKKYIDRTQKDAAGTAIEKKTAGKVNAEVMKNLPATSSPVATAKTLSAAGEIASKAQTNASGKVRERSLMARQQLIDIGRGQETDAVAGMGDIAADSVDAAINDAASRQETRAAVGNSIGSAAGAGAAIYGRSLKKEV